MLTLIYILLCFFLCFSNAVYIDGRGMNDFDVYSFNQKLDETLSKAKSFLTKEKSQGIVIANTDVQHRYEDKYLLTEQLTRSALDALVSSIQALGVTDINIQKCLEWAKDSHVKFRFKVEERCVFSKEEKREEDSSVAEVNTVTLGSINLSSKKATKYVYTEFIYDVEVNHRLEIIRGAGSNTDDIITVWSYRHAVPYSTRLRQPPLPDVTNQDETDITWLLEKLSSEESFVSAFRINRELDDTWTPVRNSQIDKIQTEASHLRAWAQGISFTIQRWFDITMQTWSKYRRVEWNRIAHAHKQVFVPVAAFFQEVQAGNHTTLSTELVKLFQKEEIRSLKEALAQVDGLFPAVNDAKSPPALVSQVESRMLVILQHMLAIIDTYHSSLDYVESMMRSQLKTALGKSVSEKDLIEYMSHHYRQLYLPQYHPEPWTVSVRRSRQHSPEGGMRLVANSQGLSSIHQEVKASELLPIETFTRSFTVSPRSASSPTDVLPTATYDESELMSFPIAAGIQVSFAGERNIHAWLRQSFDGETVDDKAAVRLVASAQQFSSYVVLLGRVTSQTSFEPTYAFIVQNKEEVTVPLTLETIPNAQMFRDAIESLSPKQQRFARAYRAMQLESTLFGIVILQIKPQLEKTLHLVADSLTKEIALTRDLMDLFINYQIPTDLLSADTDLSTAESTHHRNASLSEAQSRVEDVRENVRQMKAMLQQMKEEELKAKEMENKYERPARAESYRDGDMILEAGVRSGAMPASLGKVSNSFVASIQSESYPTASSSAEMKFKRSSASASASTSASASLNSSPDPTTSSHNNNNNNNQASMSLDSHNELTRLPQELDDAFDQLDSSRATRPTIIRVGEPWEREKHKPSLVSSSPQNKRDIWSARELQREKTAAFELLDALTRSGSLVIEHAALHVVVATTHSFTDTVMECVVQQNRNPIEDLERSSLVLVSHLHKKAVSDVLQPTQVGRILASYEGGRAYETNDVKKLIEAVPVLKESTAVFSAKET